MTGAWWPQSANLRVEATSLLNEFPTYEGHVMRLLFARTDWDANPDDQSARRVATRRGPVGIRAFPTDERHLVTLLMRTGQRLHLLVIPSTVGWRQAAELMTQATDPRDSSTPRQLIELR